MDQGKVYQPVIKNTFFEFAEEDPGKRHERRSLSMGCCPRDLGRPRSQSPTSRAKSNVEVPSSSSMGHAVAQLAAAIPRGFSLTLTNHSPSEQVSDDSLVPMPVQGVTYPRSISSISETMTTHFTVNSPEHAASQQMPNHHSFHASNNLNLQSGLEANSFSNLSVPPGFSEFGLGNSVALCNHPQSPWSGDVGPPGWNWPPTSPMFHPDSMQSNQNVTGDLRAAAPVSPAMLAGCQGMFTPPRMNVAAATASVEADRSPVMSTTPMNNAAVEAAKAVASAAARNAAAATTAAAAAKAWQSTRLLSEHSYASSTVDAGFQSAASASSRNSQEGLLALAEVPAWPWTSASSPQDCMKVCEVFAADLREVEEPSPELEPDSINDKMDRLKSLLHNDKAQGTPRSSSNKQIGKDTVTPPKKSRSGRQTLSKLEGQAQGHHLMKLLSSPVPPKCLADKQPAYVNVHDESPYLDDETNISRKTATRTRRDTAAYVNVHDESSYLADDISGRTARKTRRDTNTNLAVQRASRRFLAAADYHHPKPNRKGTRERRLCCQIMLHMVTPGFDLVPMIIGRKGCNTRPIAEATRCKLRVRGKGSGHLEFHTGKEAPSALMLVISAESGAAEHFESAIKRSIELLQGIEKDYIKHCTFMGLEATLPGFSPSSESTHLRHLFEQSGSSSSASLVWQGDAHALPSKRSSAQAWWWAKA